MNNEKTFITLIISLVVVTFVSSFFTFKSIHTIMQNTSKYEKENIVLKNKLLNSKEIIRKKTEKILLLREAAEKTKALKKYRHGNRRGSLSSRSVVSGSNAYWKLISKNFGNKSKTAYAVLLQESSGNPEATQSRTGCYGLFQIRLSSHWKKIPGKTKAEKIKNLKDPEINTKLAVQISGNGKNWKAWEAYTTGRYKRHLRK